MTSVDRLVEGLLHEGTLEWETTQLSRKIVPIVAEVWKDYNEQRAKGIVKAPSNRLPAREHKIATRAIRIQDTLGKHLVSSDILLINIFYINRKFGSKEPADTSAATDIITSPAGEKLPETISLNVFLPDGAKITDVFSRIKESLRHELEHVFQSQEVIRGSIKANYALSGSPVLAAEAYYLDPGETAAIVSAVYKEAKINKIPFTKALKKFLKPRMNHYWGRILSGNYSDAERQALLGDLAEVEKKIWATYIEYAKKRFPEAQGI
jgi:hypothetical protein